VSTFNLKCGVLKISKRFKDAMLPLVDLGVYNNIFFL
jgi:hypothetical protein